ncbi:MAG: aminodeoxychorismate synthase component I [Bacteroidales bacterium]|nr:aminodeoxychorismate synthase component I [Bacteroidales bacterium]
MKISEAISYLNTLSEKKQACFFIIDYELQNPQVWKISDIPNDIRISFPHFACNTHTHIQQCVANPINHINPIPFDEYEHAFTRAQKYISRGDTFLLNLTVSSRIELLADDLSEIFHIASAPYKLCYKNQFVVFSPEPFVSIHNNKIFTYPMKGTIDASLENAENVLLGNNKEQAEHATTVDLLRNDMSLVAENVKLTKYRYIDKIHSPSHSILQMSSCIQGDIRKDLKSQIGTILFSMLPAGSICGAPKQKTLEIINSVETHTRGYYTGIMGYFDGENLETAVMIRFIEKQDENIVYKSGGGITFQSNVHEEYEEIVKKIYVPITSRNN